MTEIEDAAELLFFDTFSHEVNTDINLDLVQFPKPVYITQVRIIPLGARVQADFPGGVRLGATNPSKFGIEFFVNDLGMPGASTFENLGSLEYNQNDCIHLECNHEKIPTDGLVLRGWYSTITLAVYGTLTNTTVTDQIASPPREPSEPPVPDEVCLIPDEEPVKVDKPDWHPENLPFESGSMEVEQFELVKSPSVGGFQEPDEAGLYKADARIRKASHSSDRSANSRIRTHSESNERDGYVRQKNREWSRSPEYRHSGRRTRSSGGDASSKWPRTPPLDSPIRPRSPDVLETDDFKAKLPVDPQPSLEEDEEQFEPILSDDEILGDDDDAQEMDEIDIEAATFERAIKVFDPMKMPVNKFEVNLPDLYGKDLENLSLILHKLKVQSKVCAMEGFQECSVDEKESFVLISEQLINQLAHIQQSVRRRNFVLNSFFHEQTENLEFVGKLLHIAVSFECACSQPQPAFKIRHIKLGVRLIELLASSGDLLNHLLIAEKLDPFAKLFSLYQQEYMALSIKLMILKSVYALLDTKEGVRHFTNNGNVNGYQHLLTNLLQTQLTRTKFALKSIVKKMNLYEALETIRDAVTKQFVLSDFYSDQHYVDMEFAMSEVISALGADALSYHQPKRFLPVSKKFEIVYDAAAVKSWGSMIQSYFTTHSLCESLLLILSNRNIAPASVITKTMELMEAILKTHFGIDYFVDDCFEATQALINCILDDTPASDADEQVIDEEELEEDESKKTQVYELTQLQRLGMELAFKVQTRFHIDALTYTPTIPEEADFLATHLHELYSQTCNNPGRVHTVQAIGLNNYLEPIIKLIEKERRQQSPGIKYKSPVLSYAVDMVDCCVRHCDSLDYLIEHGATILELAKNHENFEPSVSAVLQEMYVYLKPLEAINIFTYDDISPLVEVITRSLEYITTFPGDLIMGLRILRHLCIGGGPAVTSAETKELKHRFVALQFYSADGVQTLLHILEKLCQYFEQPGLHAPALMTIQGVHCCQIVLPTLQVLREMLTFGIQCRDVEYKDLTPIEHLMKTYFLMHYIPGTSQAFEEAHLIKTEIIKILLAYTQPNEEDEDSLHKSLWTQMIREVVKAILSGPSTFIPGLQVLAELLPLPLPLPISGELKHSQMQRLLTERKLWSAHLHPESDRLSQMIETIAPTSFPQLSDLLTRVCLQLADLAPNMTLLVSKTLTDMLTNDGPNGAGLSRLLHFFAQLTSYASVKSSALSILSGKLWELFQGVLTNNESATEQTAKCQVSVHRILENFLDSEISLISPYSTSLPELNLASALPPRELIPKIIDAVLTNLLNSEPKGTVAVVASRNLIILTEHDITFFHLRQVLMSKRAELQAWLSKVAEVEDIETILNLLETLVLFIRALTHIDTTTPDSTIPNRTLKLSTHELGTLLGYKKENEEPHILKRIQSLLEKMEAPNESLMADVSKIVTDLETCEPPEVDSSSPESINEPHLPQTEGIVTQYAARPICTVFESTDDTQLRVQYWLDPLRIDNLTKEQLDLCERVTSDIGELVSTCLPSETNLSSDCKRVLHLSASPQSNRERTPTAPCFRTRRVEVEPTTGRPEKKIYITPVRGRGFTRAPPSRGDLFRSRPPNTSRPPSLHVDDFLALETCGAQPTGPTGYNKIPSLMRGSRVGRNRGSRISNSGSGPYRKSKSHRTASPSPWDASLAPPPPQHFRTATSEPVVTPHFSSDPHYSTSHFGGQRSRGRGRIRTYLR